MAKINMGALLTMATGAGAAITSLLVPMNQSTNKYGLSFDNWNEWFMNGQEAKDYVNGNGVQVTIGENIISAYQLDLHMQGIQNGYFNSMSRMLEIESEYDEEAITATLTDLVIKDLIEQLESKGSISGGSYFVPVSDANNYVFTSTEYASQLYQYYKGANDSIKTSRLEALDSLIESAGLAYEYNGNSYNSISDLVEVYLIDNNIGEIEVENHDYWVGNATFTDSKSSVHSHQSQNNSLGGNGEAQFRDIFWNEYKSKFTVMEENHIEDYVYTVNDWYATTSYSDSRDKWIEDNIPVTPGVIDPSFQDKSLKDLFGDKDNQTDLGKNLFDSRIWTQLDSSFKGFSLDDDLSADNLGLIAYLGASIPNKIWDISNPGYWADLNLVWYLYRPDSDSYIKWQNFATVMSLKDIEAKVPINNGKVRNWWEPDGRYNHNNDAHSISNSVLQYLGIEITGSANEGKYTKINPTPLPDGRIVPDILLGYVSGAIPTESDYRQSNFHTIDFNQWWTNMPKKYVWNNQAFDDLTTLNDAIDKYVLAQYKPSIIEKTYFDWSITDPNNVLNGLSNSLVMDGYATQALAKRAIMDHIISHGENNNIWIDKSSNVKFKANTGYDDLDTTRVFKDKNELNAYIIEKGDIISKFSYTLDHKNTNYSALKDYTEDEKIMLNNYNNSGIDLFFNASDYTSLASIILNNDLSAFNSNIKNLEISQLNVVDKSYAEKWYEYYLGIDVKDTSKTYLIKTDTFISGEAGPSVEETQKIKDQIRAYWLKLIDEKLPTQINGL